MPDIAGPNGPISFVRDEWGFPSIKARDRLDAAFAHGVQVRAVPAVEIGEDAVFVAEHAPYPLSPLPPPLAGAAGFGRCFSIVVGPEAASLPRRPVCDPTCGCSPRFSASSRVTMRS